MKKLFTFVVAVFAALTVNAAVEVGSDTFSFGTPISLNGSWDGKYSYLGNFDATDYDYAWIQVENFSGKVSFTVTYNEYVKTESWGDVFDEESKIIEGVSAGVFGLPINKTKTYVKGNAKENGEFVGDSYDKHLRQISIQDQGVASNLTVVGVWLGTKAEYEAALAGNKPAVDPIKELKANGATGGWGDKTFKAFTQTGTINKKDAAIGWWLGGTDASNYDNFVLELENVVLPESVNEETGENDQYAQVVVQYQYETGEVDKDGNKKMADVNESFPFTAGDKVTVVAPLNATYKSYVSQVVVQGSKGLTFKIAKAYFAVADKTPTGISNAAVAPVANPNAPIFNLAGQKVSKAYKGVVIQNGKKFVQK